jgi:DNA polymerase elongation subunit (family B)
LYRLAPDDYITTPSNEHFVKASKKKGILPLILDELLAARKRAKKDMAAATDPMVSRHSRIPDPAGFLTDHFEGSSHV